MSKKHRKTTNVPPVPKPEIHEPPKGPPPSKPQTNDDGENWKSYAEYMRILDEEAVRVHQRTSWLLNTQNILFAACAIALYATGDQSKLAASDKCLLYQFPIMLSGLGAASSCLLGAAVWAAYRTTDHVLDRLRENDFFTLMRLPHAYRFAKGTPWTHWLGRLPGAIAPLYTVVWLIIFNLGLQRVSISPWAAVWRCFHHGP